MAKKKTMYEILEVPQTASFAEIKAAHKRLSLELMSGASGLSREDCNFQLSILDVALHTLSAPVLRDSYDAQLAPAQEPSKAIVPQRTGIVAFGDEAKARQIAAAMEDNQKFAVASMRGQQFPIKEISSVISTSASSFKIILRAVIGLMVLGFVLKVGQMGMSSRQAGQPSSQVVRAEEKLIIQEYYKKYGVRPASRAEAELLEEQNRRNENEQRMAAFAEKKKQDEYRRFIEETRHDGDRVHANLVHGEREARFEEERRQRQLAAEQRRKEEAAEREERMRIARLKQRLGLD